MGRLKISLILWKNDGKTINSIVLQPHCLELEFDLMQENNELQ